MKAEVVNKEIRTGIRNNPDGKKMEASKWKTLYNIVAIVALLMVRVSLQEIPGEIKF